MKEAKESVKVARPFAIYADIITLSTKESNTRALSLYHDFGFKENGDMNDDEIVLKLYLNNYK